MSKEKESEREREDTDMKIQYGRYTYSSYLGSSTVDNFITDLSPGSLRAFTVSPLTPLSDHSKIKAYLHRPTPNQEALKPNKLHIINKCYRWKESSVETFQNTMKQNHNHTLLDSFLDKNF